MAKVNKETMAYKNKLKYIYAKQKEKFRFHIDLNPNTEQDMIDLLKPMKGRQTYIKSLIREDMKKNK